VSEDEGREGTNAIEQLADEVLPALIARLAESGLGELEISEPGWRVRLRRRDPRSGSRPERRASDRTQESRASVAVGPGVAASGTPTVSSSSSASASSSGSGRGAVVRRTALSPAVGYFTPRAGLTTGLAVRSGDSVGTVDVLGVAQPVLAPVDGVVGRVLVTTGEAVEYGQELVRIDGIERLAES
jgi:acetyl-CoA carboxylase biotin carboxyl carrier protein